VSFGLHVNLGKGGAESGDRFGYGSFHLPKTRIMMIQ
jgi:hypothetical protein